MMAAWMDIYSQHQDATLTTEQQLDLVRRDLDALERRIAFIEATIAAIRADEDGAAEDTR